MPPRDPYIKFRALVRAHPDKDHSGLLETRLKKASDDEDRQALSSMLIRELQRTEQFEEAEAMLRADIAAHADHPYPLIALGEHYHYYSNDLPKAKAAIAKALVKARKAREFVYQSLGIQARLSIEAKDWKCLERTLRELVDYRHKTGNADVFPEGDFLPRIPSNAISLEIVASYVRRRKYLSSIGYSTLTGRSTRTPAGGASPPRRSPVN